MIVLRHGIIVTVVCLAIEILELLKDVELDVDLYVGANVQEEVGLRVQKHQLN